MLNSCDIIPKVGDSRSKLFEDLLAHTNNRSLTKQLWAVSQSRELLKNVEGLERDGNGEPTYESFSKALNLDSLIDKSQKGYSDAISLGILNNDNESIEYDLADVIMNKALSFNDAHDDFVAIVSEKDGKYIATIQYRDIDNLGEARKIKFKSLLNNKLLNIVNALGFDVSFSTDSKLQNLFNPLLAENNAGMLKSVIRVSKGEQGERSLPEEVAHLIIAGMHNHVLYSRIASTFTDDVVKLVLDEDYDTYYELYKDGEQSVDAYLRDEAMGKMLASMLKGESEKTTLFNRLLDAAKSRFKKGSIEEVDNAISEAMSATKELSNIITDNPGEIRKILNNEDVMKARVFYNIVKKTDKLKELAERGEELLSKRLSLEYLGKTESVDVSFSKEAINTTRAYLIKQQYATACFTILNEIARQMVDIKEKNDEIAKIRDDEEVNLERVNSAAKQILRVQDFNNTYSEFISTLQSIGMLIDSGDIDLNDKDAEDIMDSANEIANAQTYLTNSVVDLRFNVLKNLLILYYGKEKFLGMRQDASTAMSVEALLTMADKDIGALDGFITSLGESRSPILAIVHEMVVRQQAARDRQIDTHVRYIQSISQKLHDAGYSNDFVYDRDENGKPTGWYIGPYKVAQWYKDRDAEVEKLKEAELEDWRIKAQMQRWEEDHTHAVKDEDGNIRYIPYKRGLNGENIYESDALSKLSPAQREYYDSLMWMKQLQNDKIPLPQGLRFGEWLAPQMRGDLIDQIDFSNPQKALANYWTKLKSNFERQEDTEEFGEEVLGYDETGVKYKLTDAHGNPIKRVPVYFTHMLKDTSILNTDASQAMIAYVAMAENYSEMSKMADALILLNDYMQDREHGFKVKATEGGKAIRSKFKTLGNEYTEDLYIRGADTNTSKQLNQFIDRLLFGIKQKDEGYVKVGNTYVSINSIENGFKDYVSKLGIGANLFSGLSNVTMGEAQMGITAAAGRHFNFKDLIRAHKEYDMMLPKLLANLNRIQKTDKLSLIVDAFNATEDFAREAKEESYKKSAFRRIIGKGGWFFLQTAGEHKLHVTGALAILMHIKGVDGTSFYDHIDVERDENTGTYMLTFKDFTIEANGQPYLKFMDKYIHDGKITIGDSHPDELHQFIENLNVYINRINSQMHGGYSDAEKGNINRTFLGRMLMQFRQWMPATYGKRFSRQYYDPIMDKTTEGMYISLGRFIKELFLDAKRGRIAIALNWNQLSQEEKDNVKQASSELTLFLVLSLMAKATTGWKDKDRPWLTKMIKYQIDRLKMETGAMIPWITMPENFMQILNSPMAGTSALQDVLDLFELHHMFDVIENGRYEGWTVWERDLLQALPYRNIVKAFDLKDENYIFNVFRDN